MIDLVLDVLNLCPRLGQPHLPYDDGERFHLGVVYHLGHVPLKPGRALLSAELLVAGEPGNRGKTHTTWLGLTD